MIFPTAAAPAAGASSPDRRRKAIVALLIVLAAAGWDQGTKSLARSSLEGRPPVFLVEHAVQLQWVENEGAFLGLGARLPRAARTLIFIAFPLAVLAIMIGSLLRRKGVGWAQLAGLSLIAGGGAGNLVDRIFRDGRVGDFIVMGVGRLHTGIFNFADLAVLAGCVVLLFAPSPKRGGNGGKDGSINGSGTGDA